PLTRIYHIAPFFSLHPPPSTLHYTLSLHDALPILAPVPSLRSIQSKTTLWSTVSGRPLVPSAVKSRLKARPAWTGMTSAAIVSRDRKSTRLNSSHVKISYAVFCLKKKKRDRVHNIG